MNTVPAKVKQESQLMEKKLAKLGARIDQLIVRADQTKTEVECKLGQLREKEEDARKRGEEALGELKVGLDKAWQELNQAWDEVVHGGERATAKFLHKEGGCCKQAGAEDENKR